MTLRLAVLDLLELCGGLLNPIDLIGAVAFGSFVCDLLYFRRSVRVVDAWRYLLLLAQDLLGLLKFCRRTELHTCGGEHL